MIDSSRLEEIQEKLLLKMAQEAIAGGINGTRELEDGSIVETYRFNVFEKKESEKPSFQFDFWLDKDKYLFYEKIEF